MSEHLLYTLCLVQFLSAALVLLQIKKQAQRGKGAGPGQTVRGKPTGLKAKLELCGWAKSRLEGPEAEGQDRPQLDQASAPVPAADAR